MNVRFVLLTTLLTLALFSAACAAPEATTEPGAATAMPTASLDNSTATEEPGGSSMMTSTADAGSSTQTVSTAETGSTAQVPVTGLPDDVDDVVRILQATGVDVQLGDLVDLENVSVQGQTLLINGEPVEIFTYETAQALEAQASQLAALNPPTDEPQFYKMGVMLVRYAGSDPLVRDLLEDVLGAQAAGQ